MSDHNCTSATPVEIATAVAGYVGPLIGAACTALFGYFLGSGSKKTSPTTSSLEHCCSVDDLTNLRQQLQTEIGNVNTQCLTLSTAVDNLREKINSMDNTEGRSEGSAGQISEG